MSDKIILPDIGEGIDQVEISEISVSIGDKVTKDDIGLIIETEKASMEIPISVDGVIKEVLINNGDNISPGTEIFIIEKLNETEPTLNETEPTKKETLENRKVDESKTQLIDSKILETKSNNSLEKEQTKKKPVSASPSVRRFARELGCELGLISGTGAKGRITKDDVQNFIKTKLNEEKSFSPSIGFQLPSTDFSKFGDIEYQTLNKIRKISGQRLQAAWNTIPHVTQFDEADITALEKLRKLLNNSKSKSSPKMSYLPFIMKAIVKALKDFPEFNSSLNATGESLIIKKYFHIGIAVDTPNGLIVPVIRDINKKSIPEIAVELEDLSIRAKDKKIKPDELTGGCFTISSLGGISGTAFTPIVNPPEVAILGVSRTKWEPVYNGSEFKPRLILPLSLSYDHRVIDGADAARFTKLLSSLMADIEKIPGLDLY
tara:strand:- start:927 stop:2225 length:1299 start_codon:yes stop_codon:yes gene_type:complete